MNTNCDELLFVQAIDKKQFTQINQLLDNGVNVKFNNNYAIKKISGWNDPKLLQRLIDLGADVTAEDCYPLVNAVRKAYPKNSECVKFLFQTGGYIKSPDFDKLLLLMNGHGDMTNILVDNGVTVDVFDCDLFLDAINDDMIDLVRYMLDNGADPNMDKNALKKAIYNESDDIMQLLLEAGANVSCLDADALIYTISNNLTKIIELLSKYGADYAKINNCVPDQKIVSDMHNIMNLGIDPQRLAEIYYEQYIMLI